MKKTDDQNSYDRSMTPEMLSCAGKYLYGNWGWQTQLARDLQVDGSTVRRWLAGTVAIPGIARVAITLLIQIHDSKQKGKAHFIHQSHKS